MYWFTGTNGVVADEARLFFSKGSEPPKKMSLLHDMMMDILRTSENAWSATFEADGEGKDV